MTAASDLYPLSTQDGKAIPLDVVKPLSLVKFTMAANIAADITIPDGFSLVWVYATVDCILRLSDANLPNTLISGTEYANAMLIPANTLVNMIVVPGEASLLGFSSGALYINSVEQWAALVQPMQTTVG